MTGGLVQRRRLHGCLVPPVNIWVWGASKSENPFCKTLQTQISSPIDQNWRPLKICGYLPLGLYLVEQGIHQLFMTSGTRRLENFPCFIRRKVVFTEEIFNNLFLSFASSFDE